MVLAVLGAALVLLAATVWLEALVVGLATGQGARASLTIVTRDAGALAIAQGVGLGVPVLLAARLRGVSLRSFLGASLRPCPWDRIAAAILAGACLQLPMAELAHHMAELLPTLARSAEQEAILRETMRVDSLYDAIAVPLAVVVLAPITEELLFRAFAQPELARRYGELASIVGVSVMFAAFHGDPTGLPSILVAGLALGALAARWQSVRITIAMHAGVNAIPIALTESLLPIRGFNDADPSSHVLWPIVLASLVGFGLSYAYALGPARTGSERSADLGTSGQPG